MYFFAKLKFNIKLWNFAKINIEDFSIFKNGRSSVWNNVSCLPQIQTFDLRSVSSSIDTDIEYCYVCIEIIELYRSVCYNIVYYDRMT